MSAMAAPPVMILVWNGWEDTFECLRALLDSGEGCPVWLLDNGSDQDRGAEARAIYPGLRVIRWPENYGIAGGFNRALKLAAREGHEFGYLLNNDCAVTAGFLSTVLEVAKGNPRLAAVGSRTAWMDPGNSVMFDGTFYLPGEKPMEESSNVKMVREIGTAAALIRLAALESEGYFDERFFAYRETVDWCAQVLAHGWQLALAEASLVYHRRQRSDVNSNELYYRTRNYFLCQRNGYLRQGLRKRFLYVYLQLRYANEARRTGDSERTEAIVDGLWDGLTGRFGKRGARPPRAVSYLLANFWIFPMGFFHGKFPGSVASRAGPEIPAGHSSSPGERR